MNELLSKEYFASWFDNQKEIFSKAKKLVIQPPSEEGWEDVWIVLNIEDVLSVAKEHNWKNDIFNESVCWEFPFPKSQEYSVKLIHIEPNAVNLLNREGERATFPFNSFVERFPISIGNDHMIDAYLLDKNDRLLAMCSNPFNFKIIEASAYNIVSSSLTDFLNDELESSFKIDVKNSILSRVNETKLSINKIMIKESPYLKKGISFNLGKATVSILGSDKHLYVINSNARHMLSLIQYFKWEDIPLNINEKSIQKLFERSNNYEKRLSDSFEKMGHYIFSLLPPEHYHAEKGKVSPIGISFVNTILNHYNYLEVDADGKYTDIKKYCHSDTVLGFKLLTAFCTPQLRKQVKRVSKTVRNPRTNKVKTVRSLSWGTDKITYIYPKGVSSIKKTQHYVRPHFCKFYIKDLAKYSKYSPFLENGKYSIVKWRQGCWKGDEEISYHLTDGLGKGYSQKGIAWIKHISNKENINITHAENGGEFRVELGDNKYFLLDGYCEETNTAYEFHGDIFHGNPRIFSEEEKPNPYSDLTAKQLFDKTMSKEKTLKSMGFNVISIWEDEWDELIRR